MNPMARHSICPPFEFPNWAEVLRADASLTPGLREAYWQTVERFLASCRQRKAGIGVRSRLDQ